ncbi:MAG: GGDEF domain-containing protein [Chloroflexota bacterium]
MGEVRRHLAVLARVHNRDKAGPGVRRGGALSGTNLLVIASEYLNKQPRPLIMALGAALILLAGCLDYFTEANLAFKLFYLAPVALVTWQAGRKAGMATAVAATLTWSLVYVSTQPAVQWATIVPYWNIASSLAIFLMVSLMLSGLRGALDHEMELARTDPITGAPNSRAFFEQVEQELARSLRYNRPFSVVYLDADNFKGINDKYGHSVGDDLLRTVANTVRTHLRITDLVARIGGDEFTLLLPETGRKEADMVMSRISEALTAAMQQNEWPITFSMGVVTYLAPPPTVDALIKAADDLMYSVKRSGKNSIKHAVYGDRADAA